MYTVTAAPLPLRIVANIGFIPENTGMQRVQEEEKNPLFVQSAIFCMKQIVEILLRIQLVNEKCRLFVTL